jgi:pilus assembly protein Flp/PilA
MSVEYRHREKSVSKALSAIRRRRDGGASAVEYGLLVALIAVVIAATVVTLGTTLKTKFDNACGAVANADTTSSSTTTDTAPKTCD